MTEGCVYGKYWRREKRQKKGKNENAGKVRKKRRIR